MPPRVSVVVACFNSGRYLEEALESVRAQTLSDWELIVVDDGSDDPATRVELERCVPPLGRLVRTDTNRGLAAAHNTGVAGATGELICCLDTDDRLHPRWLELGTAALDADPGLAFVSHWYETFGDENELWSPQSCDFPALLDRNTVNGAALVPRRLWLEVGGQDESMRDGLEDWDFWITLVERGHRGKIVPEVLFFYRRHAGTMTRAIAGERFLRAYESLVRKHASSFAAHITDLLPRVELARLELLREIHDLELELDAWIEPRLADRRSELAALRRVATRWQPASRVSQLEQHLDGLSAELANAREETVDLRASWSWRLTRPLRHVVGAWRGEHSFLGRRQATGNSDP